MNNTPLALAMQYYDHWTQQHIAAAADCIAADATFETPINSYPTKDAFMQAVAFTAAHASSPTLLASFGNEQEALLLYEFAFAPIGTLRIAEHFTVHNNKITFIRHIHDTYALRQQAGE